MMMKLLTLILLLLLIFPFYSLIVDTFDLMKLHSVTITGRPFDTLFHCPGDPTLCRAHDRYDHSLSVFGDCVHLGNFLQNSHLLHIPGDTVHLYLPLPCHLVGKEAPHCSLPLPACVHCSPGRWLLISWLPLHSAFVLDFWVQFHGRITRVLHFGCHHRYWCECVLGGFRISPRSTATSCSRLLGISYTRHVYDDDW